jgi:hypothetical protein
MSSGEAGGRVPRDGSPLLSISKTINHLFTMVYEDLLSLVTGVC